MKYLIGFVLGISISSALATDGIFSIPLNGIGAVLMAGSGPDNKASVIRVDKDGYVICSKQ